MKTFKQFLNESDIQSLVDKGEKLKIQLDDTEHSIQSHLKMKKFNDDQVAWAEKYKSLQTKRDTIRNNIKTNDEQIKIARKEPEDKK